MLFTSNVREIMKKRAISIRELAGKCEVSAATIHKARQDEGIAECRLSTLGHIADALGVKVKRLFDTVDEKDEDKKDRSRQGN